MATFAYKALAIDGQDLAGELDAPDRATAVRELASRGVSVTQITESKDRAAPHLGHGQSGKALRVRPKQLAVLTRQLAVSLEAGLPLMTALGVMGQELDHAASRELLKRLGQRVQEGSSLSDALAEHPEIFVPMYVRLVAVGETGGMLDLVLTQLADMLDRQVELRERVKSASIYPGILMLVGIVSVIIIVTAIVPRIVESVAAERFMLPWPTRVMMGASDVIVAYWWLLLGGLAVVVIGWRHVVLRGIGRPWWDAIKLRVPILGRLIRQIEAGRFSRSLGILAHGGVTISEALPVVQGTIENTIMRDAVHRLAESIKAGDSIARPLQRSELFPSLLVQMIRVGENTGRLDEMLLRSASIHEAEARITLDRLVNVLPVVMILSIAVVIGFIVAGLVLAIVEFQTTGFGAMAG